MSVALKVKEYLEESGVNVVMTRTSDRDVTNEQRVKTCNDSKASAMVSIHMNSADKTVTAKGASAGFILKNRQIRKNLQRMY